MDEMYAQICDAVLRAEVSGVDFLDLRLKMNPHALDRLMVEMGAGNALLDQSHGRPEQLGGLPIIESNDQAGWAVVNDKKERT